VAAEALQLRYPEANMAVLISLIAQLAANSATAVEPPDLALGSLKAELVRSIESQGVTLACRDVAPLDPPGLAAEICKATTRGGAAVFLFSRHADGASKVIAASYEFRGGRLDDLRQKLEKKFGKPSRQSASRSGENFIWQKGAREISLRAACFGEHPCVEASQDAAARRMARSSGVFVITRPGQ
jgi:hypothetical protein